MILFWLMRPRPFCTSLFSSLILDYSVYWLMRPRPFCTSLFSSLILDYSVYGICKSFNIALDAGQSPFRSSLRGPLGRYVLLVSRSGSARLRVCHYQELSAALLRVCLFSFTNSHKNKGVACTAQCCLMVF
jgi:hypothetical protein